MSVAGGEVLIRLSADGMAALAKLQGDMQSRSPEATVTRPEVVRRLICAAAAELDRGRK